MLKIGLTGGMGSGKTTVSKCFAMLGIPIYNTDENAKKFLSVPEIRQTLCTMFGDKILTNEQVDRKKLAGIVFNDIGKLVSLNSIIHPLVKDDFEKFCDEQKNVPYVIQESAILIESGFHTMMDKIICVYSPLNIAITRVEQRDHTSAEEAMQRISKQMNIELKKELADFVIINDNQHMIISQVMEINNAISEAGKQENE